MTTAIEMVCTLPTQGHNMQSITNSLPLWAQLSLALVPAASAIFAGVGLCLNAAQSCRTNKQTRVAIVARCLASFTDDEDMQAIYYKIEYSKFCYISRIFHGSTEEKQLDKLLMHFSTAALAWRAKLLRNEDIKPLQYIICRILHDPGVDEYLYFVLGLSSEANLGEHPYSALSKMGKFLGASRPIRHSNVRA
jgi:hypothetical protein